MPYLQNKHSSVNSVLDAIMVPIRTKLFVYEISYKETSSIIDWYTGVNCTPICFPKLHEAYVWQILHCENIGSRFLGFQIFRNNFVDNVLPKSLCQVALNCKYSKMISVTRTYNYNFNKYYRNYMISLVIGNCH